MKTWMEMVMLRTLKYKVGRYDALKQKWTHIVAKGDKNLKTNKEQAEAQYQAAMDLEPELLAQISDLYRLKEVIAKGQNIDKKV